MSPTCWLNTHKHTTWVTVWACQLCRNFECTSWVTSTNVRTGWVSQTHDLCEPNAYELDDWANIPTHIQSQKRTALEFLTNIPTVWDSQHTVCLRTVCYKLCETSQRNRLHETPTLLSVQSPSASTCCVKWVIYCLCEIDSALASWDSTSYCGTVCQLSVYTNSPKLSNFGCGMLFAFTTDNRNVIMNTTNTNVPLLI